MKTIIQLLMLINIIFLYNNILFSQEADNQHEEVIIEKKSQTVNIQQDTEEEITLQKQRVFLQIGAIESKNGNKFILRKKNSKLEFFIEENKTEIFLKETANQQNIEKDNFLIIRGPYNKKAILANAIYIYKSKELYEKFIRKIEDQNNKKIQEISGIVLNAMDIFDKLDESLRPGIINLNNKEKMLFFYDENTYWIIIKKIDYSDINIGDRVILYFDQRVSLRVKNIPFKVIINRIAVGY